MVHLGVRLGDCGVVLQAPAGEGLSLDALPLPEDGLAPAAVDVGGGEVAQALVGAGVVVVLDEGPDLLLKRSGQVCSDRAGSCSSASGASA